MMRRFGEGECAMKVKVTLVSVVALTFWLGLPTLIYIAAGGIGAWRLSIVRKRDN